MRCCCSVAFLIAFAGWPLSAAAQQPPASAPAARGQVVVVADVLPDATENAKLRAAVYETARSRGFEPNPQADVTRAAANAGAMAAGQVTTEEAGLAGLRKELGATLLVRVAPEGAGQARVIVVGEGGAKSRTVAATDAAVTAAVGELLAELGAKAAAPPPPAEEEKPQAFLAPAPQGRRGAQTGGDEPELVGPEATRARWENRGGLRVSYEVRAMATGLALPDMPYQDTNPVTAARETGKATTYGVGGGLGVRLSLMYLPLPEPAKESTTWAAFRIGTGVDGNVLYYRPPVGYAYKVRNNQLASRDTEYDDQAYLYGIIPMQLGFHVGFGKHRSDSLWRGTALGIAYSPSILYALQIGKTAGNWEFNYGGIEASIDVVSIEANASGASESQIRLAVLFLPRVNDELPWLVSAGIGVVWY